MTTITHANQPIIDIHTHVLPAIDDGPDSVQSSLTLLESLRASGVDRIFCTSHYGSPHYEVDFATLQSAYQRLQTSLQPPASDVTNEAAVALRDRAEDASLSHRIPELVLGAEVRMAPQLLDDIRNDTVPTLGDTSYVLIEFPTPQISEKAVQWVHELIVRGYRPIMAHPERNLAVQKNPELVDQLMDMGVLMQLTANCLLEGGSANGRVADEGPTGASGGARRVRFDRMSEKTAWALLRGGKVSVIASDTHDIHVRPPVLCESYEQIGNRLGHTAVDQLIANANAIWMNEMCDPVQLAQPQRSGLRRWFSFRG